MADFTPEPQTTPPEGINLLAIIKAYNSANGKEFATRLTNVNVLLSDNITPKWVNISGDPESNVTLKEILDDLQNQINVNKLEILYLHQLIAKIIFTLESQGLKVEFGELIDEMKTYLTI